MKLNKDAVEALEKIHLISGVKKDDVLQVFKSLAILLVLDYLNNDKTYVPFFGECRLVHEGDNNKEGKLEAIVNCEFNIDDFIKRNIGQISDNSFFDVKKILKSQIISTLGDYLNTN